MTSNNGATYSYDARDELVSDGSNNYSYTANGDLASQTGPGGTTTFTSDAYGQQITDVGSSYTWDALNRVTSATTGTASIALTYSGVTGQLTSDGTATYSRDPGGALVGIGSTTAGRTLALGDLHDDLVGTFTPAGAALASSTTYDPWGRVIAAVGPAVQIGYQGQWTDPLTGQVNMGSRFYSPARGSFFNHDTSPAGNAYAYAGDNPVTATDLTGHSPDGDSSGHGQITQAQVDQAKAVADDAENKAASLEEQAAQARATEAQALSTLNAAASYARQMNTQAGQASQANTEAQEKATEALLALDAYVTANGNLQALENKLASTKDELQQAQNQLSRDEGANPIQVADCVRPINSSTCLGNLQTPTITIDELNILGLEYWVQVYQTEINQEKSLLSTYRARKSKADSLWNAWQKAEGAATAADNALSLAQGAYARAVAAVNQLTGEAQAATAAAAQAASRYESLEDEYDKQQQENGKPGKHPGPGPGPCSTTCVQPPPPPRPIRPPAPGGGTPNPSPNPPSQSPPGQSPSPSPGGAGQGSGSGGSGQAPPGCTPGEGAAEDSNGGLSAPGALRDAAVRVHNLATPAQRFNHSTIALAQVDLPNGSVEFYASASGGILSEAQAALLMRLGVPESNIVLGPMHAEMNIINALLPEGATISRWGIARASNNRPDPCPNCAPFVQGTIEGASC